ncbi:hypothetical protein ASPSYDRAFT_37940, partial [Aspergillus sydowii CBS 593.65]
MEDFNSETDSDYTSYWRDWVSPCHFRLQYWIVGYWQKKENRTAWSHLHALP